MKSLKRFLTSPACGCKKKTRSSKQRTKKQRTSKKQRGGYKTVNNRTSSVKRKKK